MPEYLPVDEAHPLNPINYYGFTKLEIEKFMDWYDRLKDMRYVALRYFNAVGYDSEGKIRGKEKNPQNLLPIIMETAAGVRDGMSVFGSDMIPVTELVFVIIFMSAIWLRLMSWQ